MRMPLQVICVETGEVFDSIREAADKMDRTYAAIRRAIASGGTSAGYHWEWYREEQPAESHAHRACSVATPAPTASDGTTTISIGDWVQLPGDFMGCEEVTDLRVDKLGHQLVGVRDGAEWYEASELQPVDFDEALRINEVPLDDPENGFEIAMKMAAMTSRAFANVEEWWRCERDRFYLVGGNLILRWVLSSIEEEYGGDDIRAVLDDARQEQNWDDNKEAYVLRLFKIFINEESSLH